MMEFLTTNGPLLFGITAAVLILVIVLWIVIDVRRGNKKREREFEYNRETEMLKVRINELEKEATALHERETQLLSERDGILMDAHEKADDILQQAMDRIQKSEAQIRQNRIIASCCITDARRRISDLMIEVSKRLILEDGAVLDAEQISPEAVALAESREKAAKADFDRLTGITEPADEPAAPAAPAVEPVKPEEAPAEPEAQPEPAAPVFEPAEPSFTENDGTVRIALDKKTEAEPAEESASEDI